MTDRDLTGAALFDRLDALTDALHDGAPLWRTRPWRERRMPWETDHPDLSWWCRGHPASALTPLEADPHAVDAPEPWATFARRVAPLVRIGPVRRVPVAPPERSGLADRKRAQVHALTEAAAALRPDPTQVIEWCSGLGHLGRHLARTFDRPAVLVERDPDLHRAPDDLPSPPVHHLLADALDPSTAGRLPERALWVGLHACGSLTDALLDAAAARDAAAVLSSPCCLHRVHRADHYAPRSTLGRARDPALHHDDLRMATREATHAGARRTRLRAAELHRRAAWDLWRREATGDDTHHALPQLTRTRFDLPLAEFLSEHAAARDLAPPAPHTVARLEHEAAARVLEVRQLELPRLLFRRAMELWVTLDRAAHLAERGWQVHVGTFVDAAATPRNLLLTATPPP